mmetsp:Transcript_16466/g.25391  ORF Transcript_16466/g.25391 Transcript_16466/m.25391 type:complete len:239 (-) Transcript_16466:143-859(-)
MVNTVLNHEVSNRLAGSSAEIRYVHVPPFALKESSHCGETPARNNCKSAPSFNVDGGAKLLNTLQNSFTLPTSTTFLRRSVSHFFSLSLLLGAQYHNAHRYCSVRSSSTSSVVGSTISSSSTCSAAAAAAGAGGNVFSVGSASPGTPPPAVTAVAAADGGDARVCGCTVFGGCGGCLPSVASFEEKGVEEEEEDEDASFSDSSFGVEECAIMRPVRPGLVSVDRGVLNVAMNASNTHE